MRQTPEQVVERADRANRVKENWRSLMEDAYAYAFPHGNIFTEYAQGAPKNDNIYDSTLMISAVRFANRLQTDLVPPEQMWAKLIPGRLFKTVEQFNPDQFKQFQMALDDITEAVFAVIHASNFDVSVGEVFTDLSISTGCLLVNPQRGLEASAMGLEFTPVPLAQLALECGARGDYSAQFRNHRMPARVVEKTWPIHFRKPDDWDQKYKEKPDEMVEILEATYDNEDSKNRRGAHYDVILKQGPKRYQRVVEIDYTENPWIVTPWMVVPGEVYGRGPVTMALPDARVLNRTKELILKNASLSIAPPLMAQDDSVMNFATLSISPGALIIVGRNAGALGPSLQPLVLGENFDVGQIVLNDQRQSIKEIMMDTGLPPEQGGVRSATEFITRQTQLLRDIGAPFGRMRRFVRDVVRKVIQHLDERGVIRQKLAAHGFDGQNIELDGRLIDVELLSPLGQAQKLNDMDSLAAGLQLVGSLGPEVAAVSVRLEDIADEVWKKLGLNVALLRTGEDKAQIRQMAAQIVAQQMAQGQGIA